MATLVPARDESINFDTTENLIIEGDNLETLKLLQKSYLAKVKMIYIDPPYNTGNDFIYPDDFSESLETYLRYTGQVDAEGRKFSTNTEADGRFHSKWLNMMYPRLFLARNLLRDDGVIFISIDDHEVQNLRKVCDEIFGEENFLAALIWNKNHSAQAGIFKLYHEYVLAYGRNREHLRTPRSIDNAVFIAGAMKKESTRHSMQNFRFPKGTRFDAPDGMELNGAWGEAERVELREGRMLCRQGMLAEDVVLRAAFTQLNQMQEYFYGDRDSLVDSRGQRVKEFFFTESGKLKIAKERSVFTPSTVGNWGTQGDASNKLAALFGGTLPFDTPKSTKMLLDLTQWFTCAEDIVLDFFSGSGTTAHAVLELNKQDGGERKFIMVQLPEPLDPNEPKHKSAYEFCVANRLKTNIAEIGKERIRRIIKKQNADGAEATVKGTPRPELFPHAESGDLVPPRSLDIGFKVFKLQSSNFKAWNTEQPKDDAQLVKQLALHTDHLVEGRSQEDVLYELLLKSGFPLDTKVEKIILAEKHVFSVAEGAMLICLDMQLTTDVINAMAAQKPERVICLDAGFAENDQLKTNAVQTMKAKGVIRFQTV